MGTQKSAAVFCRVSQTPQRIGITTTAQASKTVPSRRSRPMPNEPVGPDWAVADFACNAEISSGCRML